MSSTFYKSIIEDEIKVFGIKKDSLKGAAKSVATTYSRKSLTKGQAFLDYNLASNRCAYLYKYASIHTGLVTKYFRKLLRKKVIKSSLNKKETLKICCLGGGPGTDIVGLFRALALIPQYHKKVVEVTVLDICGGWRNSFKRIISSLISGEVKDVPAGFINAANFKFKLIEVDLLFNLPSNVAKILSEADIVCMVKFVSAILGSSTSVSALQVIGEKIKVGAVVLFIDNFQGNVFKPIFDISGQIGFQLIVGPLHESFSPKTGFHKGSITSAEKELFGCLPLLCTKVTVLGFLKTDSVCDKDISCSVNALCTKMDVVEEDDDDDDSWDTDEELEDSSFTKQIPINIVKCESKNPDNISLGSKSLPKKSNKYTQTNKQSGQSDKDAESLPIDQLSTLIDKLCVLVNVLGQCQQKMLFKKHSVCHN